MTTKKSKDEFIGHNIPSNAKNTPSSKYVDCEQGEINFSALLEGIRGENAKFHLNHFGIESFFLPSPEICVEYIYGMSFKQIFKFAGDTSGRSLPISRSSWFELFKTGVGYPTAKKFINWLIPLYSELFSRADLVTRKLIARGMREPSVAGKWLSFVAGIRSSKAYQQPNVAAEHQVFIDFILERCNTESAMRNEIRVLADNKKLDKQDAIGIFNRILPYLHQFTLIPATELEAFQNSLLIISSENLSTEDTISGLIKAYCFMLQDFYLSLFASYEVGCVLTYTDNKMDLRIKKGLMCRAITRCALNAVDETGKNTFFGELLEEIGDVISKNLKDFSFREMASYIPLNTDESNPSAESDSDRCYNTFKSWRKGKEVPSLERLEKFIISLCEGIGAGNHAQLLVMCNMTIGLDIIRRDWEKLLSSITEIKNTGHLDKIFPEVISRYETYYEHHLQLQLNKK